VKYSIVFSAVLVLMAMVLSACNRPTVVTPATVVAIPDPASLPDATGLTSATRISGDIGATGEHGKTGGDTVITVPSSQP